MSNYEQDIAIIEAATDGPWEVMAWGDSSNTKGCANVGAPSSEVIICPNIVNQDAEFIAHFNPTYVRELVEKKEGMRSRLVAVVEYIEEFGEAVDYGVVISELKEFLK